MWTRSFIARRVRAWEEGGSATGRAPPRRRASENITAPEQQERRERDDSRLRARRRSLVQNALSTTTGEVAQDHGAEEPRVPIRAVARARRGRAAAPAGDQGGAGRRGPTDGSVARGRAAAAAARRVPRWATAPPRPRPRPRAKRSRRRLVGSRWTRTGLKPLVAQVGWMRLAPARALAAARAMAVPAACAGCATVGWSIGLLGIERWSSTLY